VLTGVSIQMSRLLPLLSLTVLAFGCTDPDGTLDPEDGTGQGVDYDEQHPNAPLDDGKSDAPRYMIPSNIPELADPEIIVSLDGLTVHLFDRETGYQAVYPTGVGFKSHGVSVTPTGHFSTGPNPSDGWWYVPRRTVPDYFAGLPFLRLTAKNSDGANTYALHGPITTTLIRGYVSHGCMRMAKDDIINLFWAVKPHASVPVTIQTEVELDAEGNKVDVGTTPVLWDVGEEIEYGDSVGPMPQPEQPEPDPDPAPAPAPMYTTGPLAARVSSRNLAAPRHARCSSCGHAQVVAVHRDGLGMRGQRRPRRRRSPTVASF
jgi:hypothetical protein